MHSRTSIGCCQLAEIYGFEYDLSPEAFERDLKAYEAVNSVYSTMFLTINNDQIRFRPIIEKLGWRLVNVVDSLGHGTVVFMYVKNSPRTSIERTKKRLEGFGIKSKIPNAPKKEKKVLDKVVG
jgi:hypothetical protein